jgi:hypothetical protein
MPMLASAQSSFVPLTLRSRIHGILKAVISGQWRVARKALFTSCPHQETISRNVKLRKPASPAATRPHPFPLAVCTLITFLSLTPHLSAQTGLATLSGTVTDPTGALLPKATVTVTNEDTGVSQKTETTRAGVYVMEALNPGRYRVDVEHQGFKQIEVIDLVLHTQDVISRNFTLPVGAMSETIQVDGNRNAISDSPSVSLTVTREFIEDMPLNGRSLQNLEALAPGAVSSASDAGLFSINGQHDDANNFTVDGVSANTNPNVANLSTPEGSGGMAGAYPSQTVLGTTQSLAPLDALQEFKVQTSGYSAEYGRNPGGQFELTTRSGTNDAHGTLFDYFRNEALDANSWYDNFNSVPREPERQNDFGGTFGGPLVIPHLYNRKYGTFFFFSYEGLRLDLPGNAINAVPSVTFRQAAALALQPFLNSYPLPNRGPVGGGQSGDIFAANFGNPSTINNVSIRLDHDFSQKVQVFGRFSSTSSAANNNTGWGLFGNTSQRALALTGGVTARLSSALLNELRLNVSRDDQSNFYYPGTFGGSSPWSSNLLLLPQYVTGAAGYSAGLYFYGFNDSDGNSVNFYTPYYDKASQAQHSLNLVDSLLWTRGKHAFKFGGDWRRLSPLYSPETDTTSPNVTSFDDYQQGNASSLYVYGGSGAKPVFEQLSLYANDTWRISSRFTAILGLRWEFNPVPGTYNGKYPIAVDQVNNFATMQIAPAGTPPYQTRYDNFAPRAGLALQLIQSQAHPLVLRSGAGIFYDTGQNLAAAGYSGYPFFDYNQGPSVEVPFPLSVAALTPPGSTPLVPPYGHLSALSDPHLSLPYTEEWNLALDYGLSMRNTITANYVGNAGKELLFIDWVTPSVNPNFVDGFNLVENAGGSKFEALQIQDQGELSKGLRVIASYAWEHARDNASTDNGGQNTNDQWFGPQWGNSNNDVRQSSKLAVNYRIPSASSNNSIFDALTNGWLVAGNLFAQSGGPFSVVQTQGVITGTNVSVIDFPDIVPGQPIYEHGVTGVLRGWLLNPNAFQDVPVNPNTRLPISAGTTYRNEFHGPALWGLDNSMQRDFHIYEKLALTFRVDAYNILNHANLTAIASNFTPSNTVFGQILPSGATTLNSSNSLYASGAARSLQISLKLAF